MVWTPILSFGSSGSSMAGCSSKKSRSALLHECAGIQQPFRFWRSVADYARRRIAHRALRGCIGNAPSHLVRFEGRGMKQFLDREPARRESLAVMVAQESLDHVPVGRNAVGPEITAHERARRLELLLDEGQGDLGGGSVAQL